MTDKERKSANSLIKTLNKEIEAQNKLIKELKEDNDCLSDNLNILHDFIEEKDLILEWEQKILEIVNERNSNLS